jgi:hypothetical protein
MGFFSLVLIGVLTSFVTWLVLETLKANGKKPGRF